MELVLVVTFAGLLGVAVRYAVPGRDRHGLGLMPSVGIAVGSLSWVVAVWAGLEPRSVLPWVISLGLTVVMTAWLAIWLPTKRDNDDDELFRLLTETKKPASTPSDPSGRVASYDRRERR